MLPQVTMETSICVTSNLLNQLYKSHLSEISKEKIRKQIEQLEISIIRESEILPNIPTGSVEVFPDQEVTSVQFKLALEIFEYTKSKIKLQELQMNLGKLNETYKCASLENSKLCKEIADNFGISDVLYDLLIQLILAGRKLKQSILTKEETEESSDEKIDTQKEQLDYLQKRMDEVQLNLDKFQELVCNPNIDYKSYKCDLITQENEHKYLAKLISEVEYNIETLEDMHSDELFFLYDKNIQEARDEFEIIINKIKILCHLDSATLNEFFELR